MGAPSATSAAGIRIDRSAVTGGAMEIVCKDCETPIPNGAKLCPVCGGRRFTLIFPGGLRLPLLAQIPHDPMNPWRPRD